jgi:hypothetical protein
LAHSQLWRTAIVTAVDSVVLNGCEEFLKSHEKKEVTAGGSW